MMAEVYGRLTRRPGVLIGQGPWVLGNGLIGTMEAYCRHSPMLLLTDFSDATPLPPARALPAGDRRLRQLGRATRVQRRHQAGDAGARRRSPRCRRRNLRSSTRLAGQPGPVAVLFAMDSLAGNGRSRSAAGAVSDPLLSAARRRRPPMRRASRPPRRRSLAANKPVIIAGNGVRIAQGYDAAGRAGGGGGTAGRDDRRGQGRVRRNPPSGAGRVRHVRHGGRQRLYRRGRSRSSRSAQSLARAILRGRTATCSTRRARPSSRSTSSRATHRGPSRPSTC